MFNRRAFSASAASLTLAPAARAQDAVKISPLMETISTYMAGAATRALPDAVTQKTKEMVLDTIAAMLSGATLAPGRFALKYAATLSAGASTILASHRGAGPIDAALVNGLLAHSDETDDSHPPSYSHPAASIVPAALATGERFAISGKAFLAAVALGYDIGPRITETLGKLAYMNATHRSTHALSGNFGSAAAAGSAARLTAQQMRWCLSFAAQQASGIATWQRDTDHIEKGFDFAGMPARNGVTAAMLVQAGATGVDDVFSGADNFFLAFAPMNDIAMAGADLGSRYEILSTDVKKWTVGSPIQAPLDGLLALMGEEKFKAADVAHLTVHVGTGESKIVDNRVLPDICMQHMMAIMLLDGNVTFKSAHDVPRMKDPAVLAQRAKVTLLGDAALEALLPRRVAIVDVALTSGKTLTRRIETVRGTSVNPMTRAELVAKARDLIDPVLGKARAGQLVEKVLALEGLSDIRQLRPLLQA